MKAYTMKHFGKNFVIVQYVLAEYEQQIEIIKYCVKKRFFRANATDVQDVFAA